MQTYRRAKAVYDLQLAKKRRDRKYERLSDTGRVQKHRDRDASIDAELDAAISAINWERRNAAEQSLGAWVRTYMVGLALAEEPSPKGYEVLAQMERALTAHKNYMLCMQRGGGKSSFCICASLFAVATG